MKKLLPGLVAVITSGLVCPAKASRKERPVSLEQSAKTPAKCAPANVMVSLPDSVPANDPVANSFTRWHSSLPKKHGFSYKELVLPASLFACAITLPKAAKIRNNSNKLRDQMLNTPRIQGGNRMLSGMAYLVRPFMKKMLYHEKEVNTVVMPTYKNGAVCIALVHHL